MNEPLDHKRIDALTTEILIAIRDNYNKGPVDRNRVFEVLNALAFCAAFVIRGTDSDEALEWFSEALNTNLKE